MQFVASCRHTVVFLFFITKATTLVLMSHDTCSTYLQGFQYGDCAKNGYTYPSAFFPSKFSLSISFIIFLIYSSFNTDWFVLESIINNNLAEFKD